MNKDRTGQANVVGRKAETAARLVDTDSTLRQVGSDPKHCFSAAADTAGRDLYGRRDARNR